MGRNKMFWQQRNERTQLPIDGVDFGIENKTRRQLAKHSEKGLLCSNLDLNTAGDKTVFVILRQNLRVMHAVLLRSAEPYSQLPFPLHYWSTIRYHNSR